MTPASAATEKRPRASRAVLLGSLLLVGLISFVARASTSMAHDYPAGAGETGMFVSDPDSLYHFRRVDRVFEEGLPAAETDDFLNFPEGARIPWPPYYTLALYALTAPFAPEDAAERRRHIEKIGGTVAVVFGVAASLMAALAGWFLAGTAGSLVAGLYHALFLSSVNYSKIGNGDHHAWVSMLMAAMLMVLTGALARGAMQRPRSAWKWGTAAGLIAGVLIGSWVASLLYVLQVQLVLGCLVVLHSRKPMPGLPAFGLSYHLAAALVLMPAILTSPWKQEFPWMVVNLSWFHPVQLLLGALVFVPLFRLKPSSPVFRRYPWLVAGSLGLLGLGLVLVGAGPAAGIREGFDWVSAGNIFMSSITESMPLIGPKAEGLDILFVWTGLGMLALPFAWVAAAHRALFRGFLPLLPWVIAIPPLLIQALEQRRFADPLAVPMAVILGWGAATLCFASRPPWLARIMERARMWPAWVRWTGAVVLVGVCHYATVRGVLRETTAARTPGLDQRVAAAQGLRTTLDWIRENTPTDGGYSVLAPWDEGHAVEWVANRPSVATNFGIYVGREGFYTPPRFFMEEDLDEAEKILGSRGSRYVLVTHLQDRRVPFFIRVARPGRLEDYAEKRPGGSLAFKPRFFNTISARLLREGVAVLPDGTRMGGPIPFLRLVHISPFRVAQPDFIGGNRELAAAWVWEHVPGAMLEARGQPGQELQLEFDIHYQRLGRTLRYSDKALAGPDGVARLRVPYTTTAPNGDGRPSGPAQWRMGRRSGRLHIPEEAVLSGGKVRIE